MCQLLYVNEVKKKPSEKLPMTMEKGELKVAGEKYQKQVVTPPLSMILHASNEDKQSCMKIPTQRGKTITAENQEFIGYSAFVKDLSEVNQAYAKIKALHLDARHVVCAFRIPHTDFHRFQDYCDDDEHQAGELLLHFLSDAEIDHRAIFVVRYYDSTHIGKKRHEAMILAAKSVIEHSSLNPLMGQHQFPWTNSNRKDGECK